MGREVRRVSLTWEHPKDKEGHFIPLHDSRRYEMGDDKSHYMPFWENQKVFVP